MGQILSAIELFVGSVAPPLRGTENGGVWVVGGVIALALVLRLIGLDRKSVWFDEALGVEAARLPLGDLLLTVGAERNPPLYFLVQHFWLMVAPGGDGWLRLPSGVLGALGVGVATVAAQQSLGRNNGLFAGVLIAISPFAIDLSQEARPYGLFLLCASATLVCLLRAVASGNQRWWAAYVASAVLALYTHNYAVLLIAAQAAFVAVWMAQCRRIAPSAVLAFAAVGILFAPWLAHLLGQVNLVQSGFWIERPTRATLWGTYQAFLVYSPLDYGIGTNLLLWLHRWLGLLLLAVSLALTLWRRPTAVLLNTFVFYIPIALAIGVSLLATPIYVARYVSFAIGAFWTLIVHGIVLLPHSAARLFASGVMLLGVAMNLPALYGDARYSRSDLRAAAAHIRSNWQSGDLIVHTSEFGAVTFDYYNQGAYAQTLIAPGDAGALCDVSRDHTRVWLVRDYGVADPAEADQAAAEATATLGNAAQEDRVELLGVTVVAARPACTTADGALA